MHQPHQDVSPTAMVAAIEANTAEFLLAMARTDDAEERDDPKVHWIIGGSPIDYHNSVIRADLTPSTADQEIAASVACFRRHAVPGTWHVGPSMRPDDLGQRLVRYGLRHGGDEIGMALDLRRLGEQPPVPAALGIERVRDQHDLDRWTGILAQGFGEGEREAAWVGQAYARLGLDPQGAWHHYIAHLNDEPIATTTLFLGAGVAGIYFVFTLPHGRGQGIGAAITWTALRDARALGYRIGVLGASTMGYPVYRRLGFVEYCRIGIYEWK